MSVDVRPAWMVPIVYNDEAPPAPRLPAVDEHPLDYGRRVDSDAVFGDDFDDDGPAQDPDEEAGR